MTSNIKKLDPVQGLVDYILDIKPYHTKVIEILTEYVYNEIIDVTIRETLQLDIGLYFGGTPGQLSIGEQIIASGGFGSPNPFGGFTSWPVIPPNTSLVDGPFGSYPYMTVGNEPYGYDVVSSTVFIPGDRTNQYAIGSDIIIDLYAVDTVLNTRTAGDQTTYTILNAEYVTFGQNNGIADTLYTRLTVAGLLDPSVAIPPLGGNEVYAAGVNLAPIPLDSVIGYSNAAPAFYTNVPPEADPTPTPTVGSLPQNPDESVEMLIFSNSFVIDGDVEQIFTQGYRFNVVGGTTEGQYTTIYAFYESGADKTYIRVVEHIDTVGFVAGNVEEAFFGYDDSFIDQTQIPTGLTSTQFVEHLVFSWSDPAENDVIDGFQYFVKQATNPSTFQVNGDATSDVINGSQIQLIGSPSNDGLYTVAAIPTFNGQFTDITVVEVIPVTEKGGWLEKYTP